MQHTLRRWATAPSGTWGLSLFLTVACTSGAGTAPQTAPTTASATETSSAQESNATQSESDPEEAPAPAQPDESAPVQPSPSESVAQVCETNCARMDTACERAAPSCRVSCRDYVDDAQKCPVEVYEALRCQQKAEDFLLCSGVSPEECASKVRLMDSCLRGEAQAATWGAQQKEEVAEDPMPQGWARLAHVQLGFSTLLPAGASWVKQEGLEQAQVSLEGADYHVTVRPLEGKKIDDRLILRTVIAEVGSVCESKLRIHGKYETQGTTHVRFQSPCKGDQQYYGALHLKGDRAVFVYLERPGSAKEPPADLDALVFGYREP